MKSGWLPAYVEFQLAPTRADTQQAFACYLQSPEHAGALTAGLVVLTITGNRPTAITRFLDTSGEGRDPAAARRAHRQAPGTGS